MKYKDRDNLVKGLRDLADFLEDRGIELPIKYPSMSLSEWLFGDNQKARLRQAALVMGKCEKDFTGDRLYVRRQFSDNVRLEVTGDRKTVCVRRVVGTKEVAEVVIPARTEEIVEWDCVDPLLRAS